MPKRYLKVHLKRLDLTKIKNNIVPQKTKRRKSSEVIEAMELMLNESSSKEVKISPTVSNSNVEIISQIDENSIITASTSSYKASSSNKVRQSKEFVLNESSSCELKINSAVSNSNVEIISQIDENSIITASTSSYKASSSNKVIQSKEFVLNESSSCEPRINSTVSNFNVERISQIDENSTINASTSSYKTSSSNKVIPLKEFVLKESSSCEAKINSTASNSNVEIISQIDENSTINASTSSYKTSEGNKVMNIDIFLSSEKNTAESLKLRKALFGRYLDIVNRLKLKTVPTCYMNLVYCKQTHSENCDGPLMADCYTKSKIYLLKENRLMNFLKIAIFITSRNYFWGNEIFFIIFRVILSVRSSPHLKYRSIYTIRNYRLLFDNLIQAFPPCWKKIHNEYATFILSEIRTIDFLPGTTDLKVINIVILIINKLYETCQEEGKVTGHDEEMTDVFSCSDWETEEVPAGSWKIYTREEKLERLFICLHLLNKVLETELSSWMMRKLFNPSGFIFTREGPLICKVFRITEFTFLSEYVEIFLKLFIKCVCCNYPEKSIKIVERLVALLATVSNLADIKFIDNGISYPKTGLMTDMFVKQFFNRMEIILGTDIPKYIAVIEALTIPFMQYKLINLLLNTLLPTVTQKFCLQVIFDNLRNYKWMGRSSKESKITHTQLFNSKINSKYPTLKVAKITTAVEYYEEQYLRLLFVGMKSYCDFYCLDKYAMILMDKPSNTYLFINTPYSLQSNNSNYIDFDYDSKIGEKEFDVEEILQYDLLNVGLLTNEEQSTYRNDIQCMMKLANIVPQLNKKFKGKFDDWCKYFNNFFPKD